MQQNQTQKSPQVERKRIYIYIIYIYREFEQKLRKT